MLCFLRRVRIKIIYVFCALLLNHDVFCWLSSDLGREAMEKCSLTKAVKIRLNVFFTDPVRTPLQIAHSVD